MPRRAAPVRRAPARRAPARRAPAKRAPAKRAPRKPRMPRAVHVPPMVLPAGPTEKKWWERGLDVLGDVATKAVEHYLK